jgi:NAD/NADP transhydrogenase alpha subunit
VGTGPPDLPRLYLDECIYSRELVARLVTLGFEVVTPVQAGLLSRRDDEVFEHAKAQDLTIITANPADFAALAARDPGHHGILLVYRDRAPHKDMWPEDITAAIENLLTALNMPLRGQVISLNDWRVHE